MVCESLTFSNLYQNNSPDADLNPDTNGVKAPNFKPAQCCHQSLPSDLALNTESPLFITSFLSQQQKKLTPKQQHSF